MPDDFEDEDTVEIQPPQFQRPAGWKASWDDETKPETDVPTDALPVDPRRRPGFVAAADPPTDSRTTVDLRKPKL
jgi:hypothetical protein